MDRLPLAEFTDPYVLKISVLGVPEPGRRYEPLVGPRSSRSISLIGTAARRRRGRRRSLAWANSGGGDAPVAAIVGGGR